MAPSTAPSFVLFWQPFDASMRPALAAAMTQLHGLAEAHAGKLRLRMGKGRKRLALELFLGTPSVSREVRAKLRTITEAFPLLSLELSQLASTEQTLFLQSLQRKYEAPLLVMEKPLADFQRVLVAPDRRIATRYATHLTAKMQFDDVVVRNAVATNLSTSGVFVQSELSPLPGTRVQVELGLPYGEALSLPGRAVRGSLDAKGRAGVGIEFADIPILSQAKLSAFLETLQARSCRVMVADDCRFFQRSIGEALGAEGCEVLCAGDGREAFNCLVDNIFELDVLVLDLQMPDLTGSEVLDRIRRLGGEQDLRIVILSAGVDAQKRKTLMQAGANLVLDKSEPLSKVVQAVRALTEARSLEVTQPLLTSSRGMSI